MELTKKEKDILLCSFDLIGCNEECSYFYECDGSEEYYLEGKKILVKLGIIKE